MWHVAELNIARLHRPLDADENREFVAALDAINLLAERSEGFVWRLIDDSGRSSSYVTVYDDPLLIINLSVWRDVESLHHYVYRSGHSAYLRRRREWFASSDEVQMVCWWIPAGTTPEVADAVARLDGLRTAGASERGFLFTDPLPPPTVR
jgi:hypothetical protein